MGQGSRTQPGTMNLGTTSTESPFASLSDVNALAPVTWSGGTPPGNSPLDALTGNLFQNPGATGEDRTLQTTPAFGGDWLGQMFSSMMGGLNYPGPVPSALAPYGTQSSLFGNLTGLGNPLLLPMLLLMANRPTTSVPFNPAVQPESPDANQGVWPFNGGPPFFPVPGSTLPPSVTPPFHPVPPVPGGASNLPPVLPPVGHGPFGGGNAFGRGGGGGGGEGGGEFGTNFGTGIPDWLLNYILGPSAASVGWNPEGVGAPTAVAGRPVKTSGPRIDQRGGTSYGVTEPAGNDAADIMNRAATVANATGSPVMVTGPSGVTYYVDPHEPGGAEGGGRGDVGGG